MRGQSTAFGDALIEVAKIADVFHNKITAGVIDGDGALTPMPFQGAFAPVPRTGQYADGLLTPSESVDVTFGICIPSRNRFDFLVNVWGRPQP